MKNISILFIFLFLFQISHTMDKQTIDMYLTFLQKSNDSNTHDSNTHVYTNSTNTGTLYFNLDGAPVSFGTVNNSTTINSNESETN